MIDILDGAVQSFTKPLTSPPKLAVPSEAAVTLLEELWRVVSKQMGGRDSSEKK